VSAFVDQLVESRNALTTAPVTSFPPGYALATVFVNGIPSQSRSLLVLKPLIIRVNGQSRSDNTYAIDSATPAQVSVTIEGYPAEVPVRYTLDGSLPYASSQLYTGPFSVLPPARVRAAAFDGENVAYSPTALILV